VVPVVDLSRRHLPLLTEFHAAVESILRRGQVLLGPETEAFEREYAAFTGHRFAVALSSGAAALQLALCALDLEPGDEVLVPALTAVPTAAAVLAAGGTPRFVDVEATTALVAAPAWEAVRTERTRAVVPVHLYGRPAAQPATDLPVLHDAAQAHGAFPSPPVGFATAYSFYPTKNLGGVGDGGALVSDDADLVARWRRMRTHGMAEQYVHVERAQNFRMSEIEAAWLRLLLRSLPAATERRRAIAASYRATAPDLGWPADHPDHVHHLAVFRTRHRDGVRNFLADRGVSSAVHYPLALTQQPAYRDFATSACPEAEAWAAECVTVPCFPELTDAEVGAVTTALAAIPPELR
jgi:dTDP-3-amino-3,4,6-trideoxy-alpha-D-glucose transaminase